jgi:hypothetical protein
MREVEFLPEWYPRVRQRRRMVVMQTWASLALICALGVWMLLVQRNVHAREVELSSLRTDLNQSEAEVSRLEELLQLQQQLGRQDQIFLKIGRPIESTKIITTLEQLMPRDMALLDMTVEKDETVTRSANALAARAARPPQAGSAAAAAAAEIKIRLRLHGVAPNDMDLAEFLAKLTTKPFFKQTELIYTRERQDSGHVMREFEVSVVMNITPAIAGGGGSGGSGGSGGAR